MPRQKKRKMTIDSETESTPFIEKLKELCEGLYYISETDAEIFPFEGEKAEAVSADDILSQTKSAPDTAVEERSFSEIFDRLTAIEDWFGEEEKANAEKFSELRKYLEENLTDLKVFKLGRIKIDIYFVGLNAEGKLMGIKTKAVET